eukprot:CAMPEP_0171060986 /NCGR_PEP_ID=MMETSP0766_2-20121228/4146_1 /TAXON_ID=439317 /ORGANISM="Gambierdiscus australes, Strain CAWD 149" /LENGTH=451 /DNA_ID=CAMNT_0011516611 /DNA_START=34 /DNA_END=1389 /DNA_ORIENTATION=-
MEMASKDWSRHEPHMPCAVAFPASTEQVAAVVRVCAAARIPIVPRGAGTGVEGGAIPYGGAVVLSTARLRHMELLEEEMLAVVGAGIYKNELNDFLAPKGLLFGPDPSSNPTVGGMASTGGSGMSTLRYGTTKENVVSLLVVTPQGNIIRTRRRVRKSSSGYELTQLYLGSEGTLGVICEVTVRVRQQPPLRSGGLLPFPDVHSAVCAVVDAVRADPPTLLRCELLNADGVRCTNAMFKTELECAPTLFVELRGGDADALRRDFDVVAALAGRHGCRPEKTRFAAAGDELDALWEARRGCYFAAMKYRGNPGGDRVFVGDICVPVSRLAECVSEVEADCERSGFRCVICAHIADGNFHCLVPYQPHEEEAIEAFESRMIERGLSVGGTVTGEHGVGVGKVRHCCAEHGAEHIALQQAVKRALDPQGIMNPGKVLPIAPVPSTSTPESKARL